VRRSVAVINMCINCSFFTLIEIMTYSVSFRVSVKVVQVFAGNAIDIMLTHDHAVNSSFCLYHIELLAIFIVLLTVT